MTHPTKRCARGVGGPAARATLTLVAAVALSACTAGNSHSGPATGAAQSGSAGSGTLPTATAPGEALIAPGRVKSAGPIACAGSTCMIAAGPFARSLEIAVGTPGNWAHAVAEPVFTAAAGVVGLAPEVTCAGSGSCIVSAQSAQVAQSGRGQTTSTAVWTPDGGHTWSPVALGSDVTSFACFPTGRCFAGSANALYLSSNGGRAWRPVIATGSLAGAPFAGLGTVVCPSASYCFVDASVNETSTHYVSTDGGTRWSQTAFPANAPTSAVQCVGRGICYGLGDTVPPSALEESTDAGTTWRPVAALPGVSAGAPAGSPGYDDLACSAPGHCLVAGYSGFGAGAGPTAGAPPAQATIYRTIDNGATWTKTFTLAEPTLAPMQPTGAASTSPIDGIECPSSSACVATAFGPTGNLIVSSADAGATWTQLPFP